MEKMAAGAEGHTWKRRCGIGGREKEFLLFFSRYDTIYTVSFEDLSVPLGTV